MKIITKVTNKIYCCTQLKDIAYLGKRLGNDKYLKKYIDLVNNGIKLNSFVNIEDNSLIKDLINCDDIINYVDYKDMDIMTLGHVISSYNKSLCYSGKKSDGNKSIDFNNLLQFKNNGEGLEIPLIPDGDIFYRDEVLNCDFYSVPLSNCYVFNTYDNDVDNEKYNDFVISSMNSLNSKFDTARRLDDNRYVIKLIPLKKKMFGLGKIKRD